MTKKTVTLAIVCAVAIAVLLGPAERSSLGQQENIRKQPACTVFCGDGTFNTISLGAKPCWGGPLPADGAGDHFKSLSEEDQAAICRTVSTASQSKASCPAFKALAQLCRGKEEPPKPQDKKPECKARGPYDVPWFDPSAEGCEQLQDTRMNANWTAANGGTCTLTLTACNYTVLTYAINLVSNKNGKLEPMSIAGFTLTQAQLAAIGIRPIQRSECTAQL